MSGTGVADAAAADGGKALHGTGHPGILVQLRTGQVQGSGRQMIGRGHGGEANGRDGL